MNKISRSFRSIFLSAHLNDIYQMCELVLFLPNFSRFLSNFLSTPQRYLLGVQISSFPSFFPSFKILLQDYPIRSDLSTDSFFLSSLACKQVPFSFFPRFKNLITRTMFIRSLFRSFCRFFLLNFLGVPQRYLLGVQTSFLPFFFQF